VDHRVILRYLRLHQYGSHFIKLAATSSNWLPLHQTVCHFIKLATTSSNWLPLHQTGYHFIKLATTSSNWMSTPLNFWFGDGLFDFLRFKQQQSHTNRATRDRFNL
jgi:hypothetical protein